MRRCLFVCLLLSLISPLSAVGQGIVERPLAIEAIQHTDYGLRHLRAHQPRDGGWSDSVAVTALALRAFLESYQGYNEEDGPFITRPVAFLLSHARPDGAITDGHDTVTDTALAMTALQFADPTRYGEAIAAAQRYLISQQRPDGTDAAGGVGMRPTLATQLAAIEAMQRTGLPAGHPFWAGAVAFVARLQLSDSDDPAMRGGFVPAPGETVPTGLATHAGIAGLLLAGVSPDDERVTAGRQWSARHYALADRGEAAPGVRHLDAMVKGLRILRPPAITDAEGVAHVWRNDLIRIVLARHLPDGSWAGGDDDPVWRTAMNVNVLNQVIRSFR